jgi:hypothetical protein
VHVSELKILVVGGASRNTLQGAENFVPGGAGSVERGEFRPELLLI